MVDTLLWDIDDTLLNFHKSEEWAIRTSLNELTEKEIDDEALSRYRAINHSYWKKLELGEIEKKDSLWMRFRDFFEAEALGLDEIFDGIFISEEVGFEKPRKEFFDYVFSQIGEEKRATSLMIGDSLTSDMRGGNNAEITCLWYNPKRDVNESDVLIDYEISNLWDIEKIVSN